MTTERKTAVDAKRGTHFLCDTDQLTLITAKGHPLYDERVNLPVPEWLVKSIMARGVRVPILARKNGEALEIVDGRQRYKGAIEANKRLDAEGAELRRVPTMLVVEKSDASAMETMILVNEQRQADDVITRAEKALRLRDAGKTDDEVAAAFGVGEPVVRSWYALLEMSPAVKAAVRAGTLSASQAKALFAKMPREDQPAALAKLSHTLPRKAKATAGDRATRKASPMSRLRRLAAVPDDAVFTDREKLLLSWVFGKATAGDLVQRMPGLADYVKGRK